MQNIKGDRYENAFFGFSMEKPKDWHSASPVEMESILRIARLILEINKDKLTEAVPNSSAESMQPLFFFSQFPLYTGNGKSNPSIMAIVENITVYPGVKTGCDYLNITKLLYKKLSINAKFIGKCREVDVNAQKFQTQTIHMNIPGVSIIKQTVYVKLMKQGYILSNILTYFDRNTKTKLENVMNTLKFSSK
jgi:hypothetical protein